MKKIFICLIALFMFLIPIQNGLAASDFSLIAVGALHEAPLLDTLVYHDTTDSYQLLPSLVLIKEKR